MASGKMKVRFPVNVPVIWEDWFAAFPTIKDAQGNAVVPRGIPTVDGESEPEVVKSAPIKARNVGVATPPDVGPART